MHKVTKLAHVKQSNQLIEARYQLTLNEQRIVLALISLVKSTDSDLQEYEVSVAQLVASCGLSAQNAYEEVKTAIKRLMKRILQFPGGEEDVWVQWLSIARYVHKRGTIRVAFHPYLKPYLLNLKKCFTSYQLGVIARFQSQYSIRIYQLAKQFESAGNRTLKIASMKEMLQLEEAYDRYHDLKRYVIEPACREINEKSELEVTYREKKVRQRVDAIVFTIRRKKAPPTPEELGLPPRAAKPTRIRTAEEKQRSKEGVRLLKGAISLHKEG